MNEMTKDRIRQDVRARYRQFACRKIMRGQAAARFLQAAVRPLMCPFNWAMQWNS